MLTFEEALARVLDAAPELPSETVLVARAQGRVLAESVVASSDLPPFDASAMDGYAVATSAFAGGPPWDLEVHGESRTGHPVPAYDTGTACRIFTGAPMPPGADAVVMQEDVERHGSRARFVERPPSGQHVRRAGEDLRRGSPALERGTRLGPYQLGLLAAADRGEVRVARAPRVSVTCTGDELRPPGSAPRPATIPESNGIVVAALARSVGADVDVTGPARDDATATRQLLEGLLDRSDLVVTIGGVSVGDHDVVRPALEAAGVELDFYKVAMKPGKPLTFGRRGNAVFLGLPGNPVSAQVTFSLFGLPLLRKMQGEARVTPVPRRIALGAALRQTTGRRGYYAANVRGEKVFPLTKHSSGSTVSLANADALVIVPADSAGYAEGDVADVLLLSEL